jgi:hypothetical protein
MTSGNACRHEHKRDVTVQVCAACGTVILDASGPVPNVVVTQVATLFDQIIRLTAELEVYEQTAAYAAGKYPDVEQEYRAISNQVYGIVDS